MQWAQKELGWQLHSTASIAGTTQSPETVVAARQLLEGARTACMEGERLRACGVFLTACRIMLTYVFGCAHPD